MTLDDIPRDKTDVQGRARRGDWIQTFSGRQFWPLDPRPSDFDLADIAAALGKAPRYAGHTLRFYSVAEHCVLIARKLRADGYSPVTARAGLLHDASEAYLVDVPRPIKPYLGNYLAIEDGVMRCVAERYGFAWPLYDIVKAYDTTILNDEREQNMAPPPAGWPQVLDHRRLGVTLQCWTPEIATFEFLREAAACGAFGEDA